MKMAWREEPALPLLLAPPHPTFLRLTDRAVMMTPHSTMHARSVRLKNAARKLRRVSGATQPSGYSNVYQSC